MKNIEFLYQNREVCDWEYVEKIEFQGKTEDQIKFTFRMICLLGFALAGMLVSGVLLFLYLLFKQPLTP